MGLLEDLHRFADKRPVRKTGLDYFADGPYIKFSKNNESIIPERFASLQFSTASVDQPP